MIFKLKHFVKTMASKTMLFITDSQSHVPTEYVQTGCNVQTLYFVVNAVSHEGKYPLDLEDLV